MKTAIYLRQSLDRDQTKLAIDRQRTECRNLISRRGWARGWTDVTEYVDNDTSATNGHRHAYADMLADIEAGTIGAVVCYHLDRLHRRPIELEHFITLADTHRVQLATVTGEVDLSTDNGRLIARITGAVARNEVERKGARQKLANCQRAENGKAWVSRVFGYDGNEIVWDEATAIREACAALLNGMSLYSIARQWNSAGLKTIKAGIVVQSGKHKGKTHDGTWTGGKVRLVLMRPRNAGLAVYDGEIIDGVETDWPAIVSRDTWEAVCAYLADPKRLTGKSNARVHLMSGLAVCGQCGKPLGTTVKRTKPGAKRVVYQCKTFGCMKIVRDLTNVDRVVTKAVTGRLARPDAAKIFEKPAVDAKPLRKRAGELRALIKAAETDYDTGEITAQRMNARIDKLQPELAAIESKLVGANTSRKLDGLLGNPQAAEEFDKLSLDRRRAVIDTCAVVTIEPNDRPGGVFDPEKVVIAWRQPE